MSYWRIRNEGDHVVIIDSIGHTIFNAPYNQALVVVQEFYKAAKAAEEVAEHEKIAYDNAILLKTGVHLGLTNHKDIKQESADVALYDPKLRRYLGSGIRSQEAVGTPTVRKLNGNS